MRAVRLRKGYAQNNPGEVCGFLPEIAARLVSTGVAEWHEDPARSTPPTTPPASGLDVKGKAPAGPPANKAAAASVTK